MKEEKRRFGQERDNGGSEGRGEADRWMDRESKIFWGAKFAAILLQYFDNFLVPLLLMCFGMNFSDEQGSCSDTRATPDKMTIFLIDGRSKKVLRCSQSNVEGDRMDGGTDFITQLA